jgi:pyruvate dehydrogenase E1 component alpha subunit
MNLSAVGLVPDIAKSFSKKQSLEMFRRMCNTRYFEFKVLEAYDKGLVNCPIYLSIGQESISAAISTVFSDCLIFAQHRAHSVYLSFGGDPVKLRDELLQRETGCSFGRGGSPSIQEQNIGLIGHHGLIGENIPLAVGAALGKKDITSLAFFGDAAAEEDYALASMGFAITHKLPVFFICEDNDLSILTPVKDRRSWKISDCTEAMGIPSINIKDDPWLIAHHAKKMKDDLPAYINCHTCRHRWHAGTGIDNEPEWDRFKLVKKQLNNLGFSKEADEIERKVKKEMEELWAEPLQKQ